MQTTNNSHITGPTRRGSWASLLVAALLMSMSSLAQAASLSLVPGSPDIFSSQISVSYNAGTNAFSASGFATTLDDDGIGAPETIVFGGFNYNIAASIDNAGVLAGGTFSIGGTVGSLGFFSGTLLTGNLTAIGFDTASDPLEFLFDVTGGDAAALYGGLGGIILNTSGFGGTWGTSFGTSFGGVADTFGVSAIPVPAAVWLFGTALVGLIGFGKRKSKIAV